MLRDIARRVLWLSAAIVDAANAGRPNHSGVKVGGHQASSASMVDIMTALWFAELAPLDRVSVKPHASPVLHAINYLLGDLDESYLPTLRAKGGLQSYPSRLKDPGTVDFSTGSVGIGATAALWAAVAHRYIASQFPSSPPAGRFISLLGDAELDEGAIWEAVADPAVAHLGELLWVVDLNRQSLDRVVPDIQIERLQGMFASAGWQVVTIKWGRLISGLFQRNGGAELRARLETMPNEEYQRMLRVRPAEITDRIIATSGSDELRTLLSTIDPTELAAAIRDLGGHDLGLLVDTFRGIDSHRPTIVFAYTIKGRGLPTEGHPSNHSALLTSAQMQTLADACAMDTARPWQRFDPGTPAGQLCDRRARQLHRHPVTPSRPVAIPASLGHPHRKSVSTQAALGRFLADLAHDAPEAAARVVTCSPDVASSTNLGGWINKTGVWSVQDRHDWFADDSERVLRWREFSNGQHIELGIAEVNLVSLLGELGATWSRWGERLIPLATLYDPFLSRALEPWSYGIYSGGQSILVGTPSGVTLAPEGGAHQSVTTPSIGLEQPGCIAWEPAFAQDLEWCLLLRHGARRRARRHIVVLPAEHPPDRPRPGPGTHRARAGGTPTAAGTSGRLPHARRAPRGGRGRHPGRRGRDHARNDCRRRGAGGRRGQRRGHLPDQPGPCLPVLPAARAPGDRCGRQYRRRALPPRPSRAAGHRAGRSSAYARFPRRRAG